jgi:phosphate:Na+ symporter
MGTMVLLDLMGAVALLLGLHMVHSGILRAFGPDLRLLLAKALNNRFSAFAAGLGLTALLQSSTATALDHEFVYVGRPGQLGAGACDHRGANVSTTLVVQILSFNISAIAPELFIIGLVAAAGRVRASRTSDSFDFRVWTTAPQKRRWALYGNLSLIKDLHEFFR